MCRTWQRPSPACSRTRTAGRTYELAGPGVYTLRELVRITLRLIGRRRLLVPVPFAVAEVQARLFELLPSAPLTISQVDLLKADNVASRALPGFRSSTSSRKRSRRLCRPISAGRPRGSRTNGVRTRRAQVPVLDSL